jgi:thiamine-phosphate pyrophosphorylase
MDDETQIYRVIDANLNRLREGLRVCEEYFRFVKNEKEPAQTLKSLRHRCKDLQDCFDAKKLLCARDSVNDPFADGFAAKEKERRNTRELFGANIKRSQEAARVIEEFSKPCENGDACEIAKNIRFDLYSFEKNYGERTKKEGVES